MAIDFMRSVSETGLRLRRRVLYAGGRLVNHHFLNFELISKDLGVSDHL